MKGAIQIGIFAVLAVIAILVLAGGNLQNAFAPAAIATSQCNLPGSTLSVTTDPIKVTSSGAGYYCTGFTTYRTDGSQKFSSKCTNIGSVIKDQTFPGRTVSITIPTDAQANQGINIYDFISTHQVEGTYPPNTQDIDLFSGRISEMDNVFIQIKSSCETTQPSGERNVNYFTGCDNTDPTHGRLKYCTRESYVGTQTSCTTEIFTACENGAECRADSTNKIGICFSATTLGSQCGENNDNLCPGYTTTAASSNVCQPYQDRDCCLVAGGDWSSISGLLGSSECRHGNQVLSTWSSAQKLDEINWLNIILGSVIASFLIVGGLLVIGLYFRPLGIVIRQLYVPKTAFVAFIAIAVVIAVLFTGLAVTATAVVGL